jgi:hypothetical protein
MVCQPSFVSATSISSLPQFTTPPMAARTFATGTLG